MAVSPALRWPTEGAAVMVTLSELRYLYTSFTVFRVPFSVAQASCLAQSFLDNKNSMT